LAGRGYLRFIHRLQQQGWQVELIYLALPCVEMSKLRVAERVAHGGHNIPPKDIERRFARSLRNLLNDYSQAANRTRCFMNTDDKPAPVFELQGDVLSIFNQDLYQHLVKEAGL
jgi:predicted ABC-type ATPase